MNAARKYKRVVQVGTQQAIDGDEPNRLPAGAGRRPGQDPTGTDRRLSILGAHTGPPGGPVPDKLNWDLWLSQAPMREYNKKLQFSWMSWRDYAGGEMTNWGAHGLDQIQMALGTDQTGPVELWPLDSGPRARSDALRQRCHGAYGIAAGGT